MFNKDLFRYIKDEFKWLAATVLFGSLHGVLVIWQAWLLSRIINDVFINKQGLDDLNSALINLLAVILIRFAAMWAGEYFGAITSIKIKNKLRDNLFSNIIKQGAFSDPKQQSGKLSALMVEGIEKLDGYFRKYIPQIAFSAVIPIAILMIVFPIDLLSGIIFLLTAPLIPFFMILIGKQADKMTHQQWGLLSKLSSHFLDIIQGLKTIKVFNKTKNAETKLKDSSLRYAQVTLNVLKVAFLSALVLELTASLSTAVVAVEVGVRLLYSKMAFREALFILILAPEFYLPMRKLGLHFHSGIEGIAAAVSIFSVLNKPTKKDAPGQAIIFSKEIKFNNVLFQFPDRDSASVDSLSFKIKKGEMTAIVGESGSGKTTLANLLMGLLTPQNGEIKIDEKNINGINFDSWADQITWVSQNPILKSGTIADNLKLAKHDASEPELIKALKKGMIFDEISNLPDGIETKIGEKGFRLSAGQKQRIALARAFLRDTQIMIFDEPAASLDVKTEKALQKTFRELKGNKTLIVISHRLNTIKQADAILLMENGKILEAGSHEKLLEQGGKYSELVSSYVGGEL